MQSSLNSDVYYFMASASSNDTKAHSSFFYFILILLHKMTKFSFPWTLQNYIINLKEAWITKCMEKPYIIEEKQA